MTTLVLQQKSVKTSLSGLFLITIAIVQSWMDRHHQRKQLAQLEPHQLKDIGLDIEQQQQQASKPFWK